MSIAKRSAVLRCLVLLLAFGSAPEGCQDYPFEEVTPSIIQQKRIQVTVNVVKDIDILFVVDNSPSMIGEQHSLAASFKKFREKLAERFGPDKYHIAVITVGVDQINDPVAKKCLQGTTVDHFCGCPCCKPWETAGCWPSNNCLNETLENGEFQDLLGHYDAQWNFSSTQDTSCRVIDGSNESQCFYDSANERGVVLVGTMGCGFERGLAAIELALNATHNQEVLGKTFLREKAKLAVVVVSDEEDCGQVGDIGEQTFMLGSICYPASKGVDIDGKNEYEVTIDNEIVKRPYSLTSIDRTYDFLMGLKGNQVGMVKFAAIVGMKNDASGNPDPQGTTIEFEKIQNNSWRVKPVCQTPGCIPSSASDLSCNALPGTRYIALANKFNETGKHAFLDTICQSDFDNTMAKLGEFLPCPDRFELTEPLLDPGLANILINGAVVPRYICDQDGDLEKCDPKSNAPCSKGGSCIESWTYHWPTSNPSDPVGGTITFSARYNPCELFTNQDVNIEVVYATQ